MTVTNFQGSGFNVADLPLDFFTVYAYVPSEFFVTDHVMV